MWGCYNRERRELGVEAREISDFPGIPPAPGAVCGKSGTWVIIKKDEIIAAGDVR